MLEEPDADSPVDAEAMALYKEDRKKFNSQVKFLFY